MSASRILVFNRKLTMSKLSTTYGLNGLPDEVICSIAIYANDTTLYSTFDQASDLWHRLELEPDLQDTVDLGRKWVVDFNAGKS